MSEIENNELHRLERVLQNKAEGFTKVRNELLRIESLLAAALPAESEITDVNTSTYTSQRAKVSFEIRVPNAEMALPILACANWDSDSMRSTTTGYKVRCERDIRAARL